MNQLNTTLESRIAPELVKIRRDVFPSLYQAFLHDDDPLSDEQDWRNVFIYQWEKDEDHWGYALLDKGQVIGMMAMAFRTRWIDERPHKFCNLHTWWVHEEHRGRSVAMLRPLLRLDGYTVTHFTPCDRIRALTQRLGFIELDLQKKLLLPLWGRRIKRPAPGQFCFDDAIDSSELAAADRTILEDHRPYRVGHLLIRDGGEYCYVLYTHVVRYRVNYCHIHYVSNREIYAQHEPAVRSELMNRHRVHFVVVDRRLFREFAFTRSLNFWAPAHGVYKPAEGISEDQVDHLYSDVVMLRLATMPHVSFELKQIVRRWLKPGSRE